MSRKKDRKNKKSEFIICGGISSSLSSSFLPSVWNHYVGDAIFGGMSPYEHEQHIKAYLAEGGTEARKELALDVMVPVTSEPLKAYCSLLREQNGLGDVPQPTPEMVMEMARRLHAMWLVLSLEDQVWADSYASFVARLFV